MLLMRCAWHPKYRGYPWLYGIRSWRGAGVSFSDGMCGPCARQWRAEFRSGRVRLGDDPPSLPKLVPGWTLRAGVGLALATAVIFAASPLDLPTREIATPGGTPRPTEVAQALPATVTYAPLSSEPSPRIERAAASTVEPSCVGSPPARSRQFMSSPGPRASAVPARGAVVAAHVSRRPPAPRLVTTVAVSAPPVAVVPVQAP
jgi:hypothetical protein